MKTLLKQLLHGVALIAILPVYLLERCAGVFGRDAAFTACSQLLSLLPGRPGSYLRLAYYRLTLTSCSQDAFIGFGTLLSQRATELGRGIYVGPQCNLGSCRIGDDTLIASAVHVLSGTGQHRFDRLDLPIRDQGGHFEQVTIGRDCWIGNAAIIMADVGDHAVIGAGSVVTKPVPARAIAVGNPARVVGYRDSDHGPESEAGERDDAAPTPAER